MSVRLTTVWLLLSVATVVSWFLSGQGSPTAQASWVGLGILVIALLKVALVMAYFMELSAAPRRWQLPFIVWGVALLSMLCVLYWYS